MNRQITRLAVAGVVLIAALIVATTYWQAWAAPSLEDRQENAIQRVHEFTINRGRILAGDRRTVVRPFADWNLYAAQRHWYGRTWDWYTIEGPFVVKRDGRYYCFFSGGAWREPNYGVGYAVADAPLGPWEVVGAEGPTILKTIPDAVLGQGRASIVASPSGTDDYIVYHAWDTTRTARRLCIDRLRWGPEGPLQSGPTFSPQPVPQRRPG